jgi:hypothetical protein
MWGSWFGITLAGLLAVLLLIAIAFGTSALLFPVLIAAALGALIALVAVLRRLREAGAAETRSRNPRTGGAPASGEGSGSPTSSTGPAA